MAAGANSPLAIRVTDVSKTFAVPATKVDSFKERLTGGFGRREVRELHALESVSFDVHEGEFFGIVGRNGSGKSTLLKILASIYKADSGRVQMAGSLAPFIELGVGFNPELTSRENVVLNGVLMGLGRREAQRRLDAVLDFAELAEFSDLKLKNYSSGMLVRLAFSVMVEADADVMLIDEVLAVGDAAFARKCMDVFADKRRAGKTIVLVTHDMATVQAMCDRAMLIHDGGVEYNGDPEETALRYYRRNFHGPATEETERGGVPDVNVRLVDAWLTDPTGSRADHVEQGQELGLHARFEARHDLHDPVFGFHFLDEDENPIFGFNVVLEGGRTTLRAGEVVDITGPIENRLLPGRYFVHSWISRNRTEGDLALHVMRMLDFHVFGTRPGPGSVSVESDVRAAITDGIDR